MNGIESANWSHLRYSFTEVLTQRLATTSLSHESGRVSSTDAPSLTRYYAYHAPRRTISLVSESFPKKIYPREPKKSPSKRWRRFLIWVASTPVTFKQLLWRASASRGDGETTRIRRVG